MGHDSGVPPEPEHSETGPIAERDAQPGPAVRYGILAIARHVKDDGRALLLYTDSERRRA
jgi:acetamidase/formamidase